MKKNIYLLEKAQILDLKVDRGYYDEKRMINLTVEKSGEVPLMSLNKKLTIQSKTLDYPGDDEEEEFGIDSCY